MVLKPIRTGDAHALPAVSSFLLRHLTFTSDHHHLACTRAERVIKKIETSSPPLCCQNDEPNAKSAMSLLYPIMSSGP